MDLTLARSVLEWLNSANIPLSIAKLQKRVYIIKYIHILFNSLTGFTSHLVVRSVRANVFFLFVALVLPLRILNDQHASNMSTMQRISRIAPRSTVHFDSTKLLQTRTAL
jgi:hypothetical protein